MADTSKPRGYKVTFLAGIGVRPLENPPPDEHPEELIVLGVEEARSTEQWKRIQEWDSVVLRGQL